MGCNKLSLSPHHLLALQPHVPFWSEASLTSLLMFAMQVFGRMAGFPSNDTKREPSSAGLHMRAAQDAEKPPLPEPSCLGYTWYASHRTCPHLLTSPHAPLLAASAHHDTCGITLCSAIIPERHWIVIIGNTHKLARCCHGSAVRSAPIFWLGPSLHSMPKAGQHV